MIDVHGAFLTSGIRINSSLVVSKAANNLESDRNGSDHEKVVAEVLLAKRNVVSTTNDSNTLLKSSKLALLINCTVRVEIFGNKATGILDVFKSVRGETTFATMVVKSSSAVNELLLTQIPELSVLFHEVRFHGSNCGECPAAAALGLILHRSNYSIVAPIPMSRDILDR